MGALTKSGTTDTTTKPRELKDNGHPVRARKARSGEFVGRNPRGNCRGKNPNVTSNPM